MEIFRRLGVARTVRDAGLPADYPNDVAFRTTTTGIEFARIPIPCRRRALHGDRRAGHVVADAGAAASDQPDLSGAAAVRPRRGDAGRDACSTARASSGLPRSADGVVAAAEHLDGGETLQIACALPGGLRRRALGNSPADRRQADRRRGGGTHAVQLHPRALADRADAGEAGLVDAVAEPAAQRQHLRDRRARDLADPQLPAPGGDRLRRGGSRPLHPADPGRRAGLRLRGAGQGGLDRPAHAGRPVPRPARVHLRRRGAYLGAVRAATA